MIYLDTSVALAQLLAEDERPPEWLWNETLVSSRLLEYELWTRIHARKLARTHGEAVQSLVGRLAILELSPPVLTRALEPFPTSVRTLDALHLASLDYLKQRGQRVSLASYDRRLRTAAEALSVEIVSLDT
jgi:predicted nucleic acid-binding protein